MQAVKLLEKIRENAEAIMENDFPTIIKQSITIAQKCTEVDSGIQAVQVLRFLLSRAPAKALVIMSHF